MLLRSLILQNADDETTHPNPSTSHASPVDNSNLSIPDAHTVDHSQWHTKTSNPGRRFPMRSLRTMLASNEVNLLIPYF